MKHSENRLPREASHHLVEQMLRIGFRHHSVCEQTIGALGVHHSQHRTLMYLSHSETPPSQKEMADSFGISKAAVSVSLDKLAAAGYIERTPSRTDFRQNKITITPKGKRVIGESEAIFSQIDSLMFAGFTDEDAERFSELLARVADNLKAIDTQEINLRNHIDQASKEESSQ